MNYTMEKELTTLSSTNSTRKVLAVVSWNDRPAKLDLRNWRVADGEMVPGKGLTLSNSEAAALVSALSEYLSDER